MRPRPDLGKSTVDTLTEELSEGVESIRRGQHFLKRVNRGIARRIGRGACTQVTDHVYQVRDNEVTTKLI